MWTDLTRHVPAINTTKIEMVGKGERWRKTETKKMTKVYTEMRPYSAQLKRIKQDWYHSSVSIWNIKLRLAETEGSGFALRG